MRLFIIIAAPNPWTLEKAKKFCSLHSDIKTHILTGRNELTVELLDNLQPDYVFFPHWSWYIQERIYENHNCVIFHPTNVPFGRGGTPIQNLIALGHKETVISAIKAAKEIDSGDVLLKHKMSLLGGGEEILLHMQDIIFEKMIPSILENKLKPIPQSGKPTIFKRRTPEMSELHSDMTISQIFDTIRMLDIVDYPNAFIKWGNYKISFSRPALRVGGIEATIKLFEGNEKND